MEQIKATWVLKAESDLTGLADCLPAKCKAQYRAAGVRVAASHLYFGCRDADKDFYYADLWRRLQSSGVLAADRGLVTAFSRSKKGKVYVTQRLAENATQLLHLLRNGAYIFVSGSAEKMPQEVAAVFREAVLQECGSLSATEALKYLRQMEISGRYVVEAWS